ncbi:MAG: lytic transglycosylase domain-containing protein [Candidatus Saccharibacteria bacterium]|nr:lytic transglycosylase domain-containing protein [Pseudorhodobacter sp.]
MPVIGWAVMGWAQDTANPRDFTFHRLSVNDIKPGKRITVQIDPAEQAALLAAAPKIDPHPQPSLLPDADAQPLALSPVVPGGGRYDWYWNTVPVAREASDGRFPIALAALNNGPDGSSVTAPRLQSMQNLAEKYGTEILVATIGTNVSPALVLAVMGIESMGNPEAVSSAGATGLMQLIPATAARFGVTDVTDPAQNIKGGVAYLNFLMGMFNRDPVLVLAAYNAGEGAVTANDGVPPYAETRDYVPKVLAAWTVAQGLCMSPPELVSDPCVFRIISASN